MVKVNFSEKNREMFNKYKQTNNQSLRDEIILFNMGLVKKIALKYKSDKFDFDELVSIGTIGLIKAVDSFDITKEIAFATYATMCIENQIKMSYRNRKKEGETVSFNEPIGEDILLEDVLVSDEPDPQDLVDDEYLVNLVDTLPDVIREMIKDYYGIKTKKLSQYQMEEKYNLKQSYISRKIKKGLETLRNQYVKSLLPSKETKYNLVFSIDGIDEELLAKYYSKLTKKGRKTLEKGSKGEKLSVYEKNNYERMVEELNNLKEIYNITIEKFLSHSYDEIIKVMSLITGPQHTILTLAFGENLKQNNTIFMKASDIRKLLLVRERIEKSFNRMGTIKNKRREVEYLSDILEATEEEMRNAINSLNENEKTLVYVKHGQDLLHNSSEPMTNENKKAYRKVIRKLKNKINAKRKRSNMHDLIKCTPEEYDILKNYLTEEQLNIVAKKIGMNSSESELNVLDKKDNAKFYYIVKTLKEELIRLRSIGEEAYHISKVKKTKAKTLMLVCGADYEKLLEVIHTLPLESQTIIFNKYGEHLDEYNKTYTNTRLTNIVRKIKKQIEKMNKKNDVCALFSCTKEEYEEAFNSLSDKHKNAIRMRLESPLDCSLTKHENNKYYSASKLLKNKIKEIRTNKTNPSKESVKSEALNNSSLLRYIQNYSSPSELLIVSMKLGFINGIKYSNEQIATILNIEPSEVPQVVYKFLLKYKKKITKVLDDSVDEYNEKQIVPQLEKKEN